MRTALLYRVLLLILLLWAQVSYAVHDVLALDAGHVHSGECIVCYSGHFAHAVEYDRWTGLDVAAVPAPVAASQPFVRTSYYQLLPIRAPPISL